MDVSANEYFLSILPKPPIFKNYVKEIKINDKKLFGNYKNYISKNKNYKNIVMVLLNKKFKKNDNITISLDSGYSWVDISEMFSEGDSCVKFELSAISF